MVSRYDGQAAFDLPRSGNARHAFYLDRESAAVRDRYGRHKVGQSLLLARPLIEGSVSLATLQRNLVTYL